MDLKKVKEMMKKGLIKFDTKSIKVGWCENEECIKIIVSINDLDTDLREIKDAVESVLAFYTDKYILLIEI